MSRKEYFGRFDLQRQEFYPPEVQNSLYGICLLDGREIKQVWAANTETGVVKTYDVLGDGHAHLSCDVASDDPRLAGRNIEGRGDMLTETLHGKVQIFGPEIDQ